MAEGPSLPDGGNVSYWPPGARYPDAELIDGLCLACGHHWRAHRDLAGSALRCRCGAMVEFALVPEQVDARAELAFDGGSAAQAHALEVRREVPEQPLADDLSISSVVAPESIGRSSLALRTRWTNRAFLELAAFMAAFLLPSLILYFTATGEWRALFQPVASLVASVLVIAIGATSRSLTFGGLKRTHSRFALEAAAVAVGSVVLALAWVAFARRAMPDAGPSDIVTMRDVIGLPMTLFVVAFCPAVFEELAFRGLIHARFTALLGLRMGILCTGVAFALAHGVTIGFPFHVGLGIYLSFMRERSDSLLPGMLLHFIYNGVLVVLL